jgi:hypothetical protein
MQSDPVLFHSHITGNFYVLDLFGFRGAAFGRRHKKYWKKEESEK